MGDPALPLTCQHQGQGSLCSDRLFLLQYAQAPGLMEKLALLLESCGGRVTSGLVGWKQEVWRGLI